MRILNLLHRFGVVSIVTVCLFLPGCGGGGGNAPAPIPASITAQPADQSVVAGTTATFSVTASDSVSYQWQISTDGGTTFTDVAGATAASYTTPVTILADSGNKFRVVVSRDGNSVNSSAATLTVTVAPVAPAITTHPANQSVIETNSASFSAVATGTPTLQWQLSTDAGANWSNINGATSDNYTTPATVLADSGNQYRMVATNSAGTASSNAATLTVTAATLAFNEALTFVRVGASNTTTIPTPLRMVLASPAAVNTFVVVTPSDASLSITGGGVTVLTGQTSAQVLMNGLAQSAGVTLTATLSGAVTTSTVRVLGVAEQPAISSLTPAAPTIVAGGAVVLTVGIDIPAPAGGTEITVTVRPSNAGTVPTTVTVSADQTSATFAYTDASLVNSASVDAMLGSGTLSSTIQMLQQGHLVINEVDYDNLGTDTAEFIEIYNPTSSTISLAGYSIMLVDGATGSVYRTIDLSPATSLDSGQFLLVGSTSAVSGVLKSIDLGTVSNIIQNGAPDGIALVNTTTNTLIDALSYEGAITAATLTGFANPVSLVEGTMLPASTADSNSVSISLCRSASGTDTDDAANDWSICTTLTPGAVNVP